MKRIRNCTYNEDLTTTSYFCDIPKIEKPKVIQPPPTPVTTTKKPVVSIGNARDNYFVNLRQICGKPGKTVTSHCIKMNVLITFYWLHESAIITLCIQDVVQ